MPDFGFIGAAYTAESVTQDAQDCVNWYPEIDPVKTKEERGVIALYPTPGWILKGTIGAGPIRGMQPTQDGQSLYVVSGNALYKAGADFSAASLGTLDTSAGPVSITENANGQAYLCDGLRRYAYSSNTFTTQSDGAFNGADRIDSIDNFLIYNQPNGLMWGATSAASIVSPGLSFGRKDSAPDYISTLIANKREVFVLGLKTSEVWIDAGLFPFPFQKLPGTNMQHGCAAKASLARLGESFAFLAQDDRGQAIVVMMNGYKPTRISTHAVENDIQSYAVISDALGMSYQENGHEFYVLTFPTADKTWCFDLATGFWHRRAVRDSFNVLHRDNANCMASFQGLNIIGDSAGKIYSASLKAFSDYSDNPNPIPRIRRCRHLTEDLHRVFYHDLQLQFQPGPGLATGQGSDPQAMLRWSDDGGFTWSQERWVSIGKQGAYKNRARWPGPLGSSRDRIFEVVVTDPVFSPIISANLNFSIGAS